MSVMDELNVDIQTAKDYVAKKNSLIELYNNNEIGNYTMIRDLDVTIEEILLSKKTTL